MLDFALLWAIIISLRNAEKALEDSATDDGNSNPLLPTSLLQHLYFFISPLMIDNNQTTSYCSCLAVFIIEISEQGEYWIVSKYIYRNLHIIRNKIISVRSSAKSSMPVKLLNVFIESLKQVLTSILYRVRKVSYIDVYYYCFIWKPDRCNVRNSYNCTMNNNRSYHFHRFLADRSLGCGYQKCLWNLWRTNAANQLQHMAVFEHTKN